MGRNKVAAREAKRISRWFDPKLKEYDAEGKPTDKYGKSITPKGRSFHRIIDLINVSLKAQDPTIPRDVSAAHYAVIGTILKRALRSNEELGMAKCPNCKKVVIPTSYCSDCLTPVEVFVPHEKLEKNSNDMLEVMIDRMAPKLATQTTEINVYNTIVNIGSGLAQIVTRYVPAEMQKNCLIEVKSLLESHKNAIQQDTTPTG